MCVKLYNVCTHLSYKIMLCARNTYTLVILGIIIILSVSPSRHSRTSLSFLSPAHPMTLCNCLKLSARISNPSPTYPMQGQGIHVVLLWYAQVFCVSMCWVGWDAFTFVTLRCGSPRSSLATEATLESLHTTWLFQIKPTFTVVTRLTQTHLNVYSSPRLSDSKFERESDVFHANGLLKMTSASLGWSRHRSSTYLRISSNNASLDLLKSNFPPLSLAEVHSARQDSVAPMAALELWNWYSNVTTQLASLEYTALTNITMATQWILFTVYWARHWACANFDWLGRGIETRCSIL